MNILKSFFKKNFPLFLLIFLLWGGFSIFDQINLKNKSESEFQKINSKMIIDNVDQNLIISKYINWYDFKNNYYFSYLKIRLINYFNSIINKENSYATTIKKLYLDVFNNDKLYLNLVYKELNYIRKDRSLSKRKFAEMIVSMVQEIPYSIVAQETCASAQTSNEDMRKMILSGIECDGEIYGGVYTPTEFVYNLKGDCDSRTLFIYTVLKYFNYDVVILNSDLYAHSIIGLNLPSSGRYKYHKGNRYYTWETTYKGWELGLIPAKVSNINYWYVALD